MESRDYIHLMSESGIQPMRPNRCMELQLPLSDLPESLQQEFKGSAAGVISKSLIPQKKLLQTAKQLVAMLEENKIASDLLAKLDNMEDYNRRVEMLARIEDLEEREKQIIKDRANILEMQKMIYADQQRGPAESIVRTAVQRYNDVHRGNTEEIIRVDEYNLTDRHFTLKVGNNRGVNFRQDFNLGWSHEPFMKDYAYKQLGSQLIMAGLQMETDKPAREYDYRIVK